MSAHLGTGKCPPGRTWFGASATIVTDNTAEALLGTEIEVKNKVALTSKTRRNEKKRWLRFVKNASGVTLYPKLGVIWGTANVGTHVYGVQSGNLAGAAIAGIVDDWLPSAGVRPNDYFWIVVEGEVLGLTPIAAGDVTVGAIAAGDLVMCGITTANSTGATSGSPITAYTGGRITKSVYPTFTATQTTDGTMWSSARHSFARALSARTTNETQSDILIEIVRRLK